MSWNSKTETIFHGKLQKKGYRVIIRGNDNGAKIKAYVQAKYMLMSLAEVHRLFSEDTKISISRSKFCDLKPEHKAFWCHSTQCMCLYLLWEYPPSSNRPENISEFTNSTVCDTTSTECMATECSACHENINPFRPRDSAPVNYHQWQTAEGVTSH